MLSFLATSLLALLPQAQNQIVLVDGSVLDVDRITSETYEEVTYKRGSSESRKASDQVAEVRHAIGHRLLETYAFSVELMDKGLYANAIANFEEVLGDDKLLNRAGYQWVRQHTLFRIMRCQNSLANFAAVSQTADRLVTDVPDTFFYAPALLMKAQAMMQSGNKKGASGVFQQMQEEVRAKGLPERWNREAELGLMLLDAKLEGAVLARSLQGLVERNSADYPAVAARARVEVGNAMVQAADYAGARTFFTGILDEGVGGDLVLAGAISGKADCAYRQALALDSAKEQKPFLEEAILDFLTVASVYREQVHLVPRAMYYAGDALKRIGDPSGAKQVANALRRRFPDSRYKKELFNLLNLK